MEAIRKYQPNQGEYLRSYYYYSYIMLYPSVKPYRRSLRMISCGVYEE